VPKHVGNAWRRQLLDHRDFDMPVRFTTEDNDVTRWLAAALAEYESLRAESLQAQQAQLYILQFGITGVAVLIGLGLQKNDPLLAIPVLLFLVPLLSMSIAAIWFVEIFRSSRAGTFISCLEERINRVIGGDVPALGWETWLRRHPKVRMAMRDRMSFSALYLLNVAGLSLGFYLALHANFNFAHPARIVATFVLWSGIILVGGPLLYRRLEGQVRLRVRNIEAALNE
jgi:hypothetical protein